MVRSGLTAYGLETTREFVLGIHTRDHKEVLGQRSSPTDIKDGSTVYYELSRFQKMGLKGFPRVIETLFCEASDIVYTTDAFKELRRNRNLFMTKQTAEGVMDMAKQMFEEFSNSVKIESSMAGNWYRQRITYKVQAAASAVRLARMAVEVLKGRVHIRRVKDAAELNGILRQQVYKSQIAEIFNEAHKEYEELMMTSKVPDSIDEDQLQRVINNVYRKAWKDESASQEVSETNIHLGNGTQNHAVA